MPATVMDSSHAIELAGLRRYLLRMALTRMRDAQRAEEVVQETLLAALEDAGSFAGRSQFRTWVTGILIHKVTDAFRAGARDADTLVAVHDPQPGEAKSSFAASAWRAPVNAWSDPECALETKRFRDAFEAALAKLTSLQSGAFVMRELMGLETEAICAALNVTPTHLWVLLHRARFSLRRALGRDWFVSV